MVNILGWFLPLIKKNEAVIRKALTLERFSPLRLVIY